MDAEKLFDLKSLYFNCAYLGPIPLTARDRMVQMIDRCLSPDIPFSEWVHWPDKLRELYAELLGGDAEQVAISTSVSEMVNHIANGLQLGPDDEVVLLDGDAAPVVLPFVNLAEIRKFKINLVDLSTFLEPQRLQRELNKRTKFVGVSHVMFNTGAKLPVAELARISHGHGALFLADISQSFGGMQLDEDILKHADILVGTGSKWLLGPYGTGFGYFSPHAIERIRHTHANWTVGVRVRSFDDLLNYENRIRPGARKFDRGQAAAFIATAGMSASLELIKEIGLKKIQAHNATLVDLFLDHVPEKYDVSSPCELRSNIVCIKAPHRDSGELAAALKEHNIQAGIRDGTVRLAFHFFNTAEQVEMLVEALS